jgi:hypothetical protein
MSTRLPTPISVIGKSDKAPAHCAGVRGAVQARRSPGASMQAVGRREADDARAAAEKRALMEQIQELG